MYGVGFSAEGSEFWVHDFGILWLHRINRILQAPKSRIVVFALISYKSYRAPASAGGE